MVERDRQVHQQRITEEQFDLKGTLSREKNQDLIILLPGQQLSLKERLRRRRQLEIAEAKIFSDIDLSHPVPKTVQQRREEYLHRQLAFEELFYSALAGYEELLNDEERRIAAGEFEMESKRSPQARHIWYIRSKIRKKVERHKLEPEGIYSLGKLTVSDTPERTQRTSYLANSVLRKALPAVLFLNKYYSTQTHVRWMENTKRGHLGEQHLAQELMSVREAFSENDYRIIKKNTRYSKYLQMHNGVLFVARNDRQEILDALHPPTNEYRPLSELVSDSRERDRLKAAILRGRMEGITRRGTLMTTKDAITAYEESIPDSYKKRRKSANSEALEK